MPQRPLTDVLAEHAPRLMAIPGVAIVYEGAREDGTPCIRVGLLRDDPEVRSKVPETLEGYAVLVDETGPIAPQ